MKETITKEEYLQLVGLLTLARGYRKTIEDCQRALCAITGEEDKDLGALSGDYIWEDGTVDELLKALKIKVNGSKKLHNKSSR